MFLLAFIYLFIYSRPEMEVYKEINNNSILIGKIINKFDCCNMRFLIKNKMGKNNNFQIVGNSC